MIPRNARSWFYAPRDSPCNDKSNQHKALVISSNILPNQSILAMSSEHILVNPFPIDFPSAFETNYFPPIDFDICFGQTLSQSYHIISYQIALFSRQIELHSPKSERDPFASVPLGLYIFHRPRLSFDSFISSHFYRENSRNGLDY